MERRLKKILKRALHYVRQGYALASLPFVFLGYTSSIYYLAIENMPSLHTIFPRFHNFLIVAGLTLPILCGLIGYLYMKRSWLFRVSQEINVEANPYQTVKIPPVSVPFWEALIKLCRQRGIDTAELEKTVERSKNG